jgi:acetyl esterase/lipase
MKPSSRALLSLLSLIIAAPLLAQTKPTTVSVQRRSLPPGATVAIDVKYADVSPAEKLDIYLPPNPTGSLPVVVCVHGGGWLAGDKQYTPAAVFLAHGYAVASINYRFSSERVYPAQIHDCKAALRWLRAHAQQYHLDPHRFGVWGDSAGGHLVALLGTTGDVKEVEGDVGGNLDQSSRVQCVVDWFGPTDMSVFWEQADRVENVFKSKPDESPITKLFGAPVAERKDLVRLANPVAFVSKDDPPFLILHGDKDTLVPLAQSEMLADALNAAGVEVHLEVLRGAGHGGPAFASESSRKLIFDFFEKQLKK